MTQISRRNFLVGLAATNFCSKTNSFLDAPKPKFSLGQNIVSYWQDETSNNPEDQEITYFYRGQIVGMCWKHPNWIDYDGWLYFVKVTESNDLTREIMMEFPEYELE